MIIRLRIFLESSFISKSYYSLLHALQTTLIFREFRIIPVGLISNYITFFPERLDKFIYLGNAGHGLVKI